MITITELLQEQICILLDKLNSLKDKAGATRQHYQRHRLWKYVHLHSMCWCIANNEVRCLRLSK